VTSLILSDPARHEPLADLPWDEARACDAIARICRDAEAAFDPATLWPLHPRDDEPGTPPVLRGIYLGAAGMLHGLARLAEAGVYEPGLDLARLAGDLAPEPDEEDGGASLLAGTSGILLVAHRLAPSRAVADALADAIAAHAGHPANELLYGTPGTMLAARAMHARTGEDRFATLWRADAEELLARRDADGLWTQQVGSWTPRALGAAHGFAGNVRALLGAREWLEDAAEMESRAVATLQAFALRDADGDVNWAPVAGERETDRVQWCHGAPGMASSLPALAPGDDGVGALLAAGGDLTWRAGPLSRDAGLCHGTAGNGFAFLALLARTGDERWLGRARAFAMHALAQVERFRAADGRGRYALFTGDIGAALLAAACLRGEGGFPGIDDL
jgi:hypothetical protein